MRLLEETVVLAKCILHVHCLAVLIAAGMADRASSTTAIRSPARTQTWGQRQTPTWGSSYGTMLWAPPSHETLWCWSCLTSPSGRPPPRSQMTAGVTLSGVLLHGSRLQQCRPRDSRLSLSSLVGVLSMAGSHAPQESLAGQLCARCWSDCMHSLHGLFTAQRLQGAGIAVPAQHVSTDPPTNFDCRAGF